ncbi:MAG: ABC transporter permease [Parasporobacterium sp.]|nr:ABC transporter permease [Parasporobacterium sp.]
MSKNTLVSKQYRRRSPFKDVFHRLTKNKGAVVGLCIIGALILLLLASFLIDYSAVTKTDLSNRFLPPSWQHLFGTDDMGRDVFLRVVYGTRYSLSIGFGATALAAIAGVCIGSVAGYYGGFVDDIIMRLTDILASIPAMLLGMVIVSILGGSVPNLIFAIGICSVQYYIRITRASILAIRGQEYVEAAKVIGMSDAKIIFTQILPNAFSPVIVTFTATIGIAILVAASLSFIGLGVSVPMPEWGALVSSGRNVLRTAPYLSTFPGLFIMLTVLAFNILGDGLRDALDPKLKR